MKQLQGILLQAACLPPTIPEGYEMNPNSVLVAQSPGGGAQASHPGSAIALIAAATLETAPPEHVLLRAGGDCMEPTICRGDLVLVRVGVRPENGGSGVYVFRYPSGAMVFRRTHILWDLTVQLLCDNSRYITETLSLQELGAIPCLGRVQALQC